eukprot:3657004-Pyramimonas_sp.AAC.1
MVSAEFRPCCLCQSRIDSIPSLRVLAVHDSALISRARSRKRHSKGTRPQATDPQRPTRQDAAGSMLSINCEPTYETKTSNLRILCPLPLAQLLLLLPLLLPMPQ